MTTAMAVRVLSTLLECGVDLESKVPPVIIAGHWTWRSGKKWRSGAGRRPSMA